MSIFQQKYVHANRHNYVLSRKSFFRISPSKSNFLGGQKKTLLWKFAQNQLKNQSNHSKIGLLMNK